MTSAFLMGSWAHYKINHEINHEIEFFISASMAIANTRSINDKLKHKYYNLTNH